MKTLLKTLAILCTSIGLISSVSCTPQENPDQKPDTPETPETPENPEEPKDTTDTSGIIELTHEIQTTYQTLHFDGLGEYQLILSNTDKIDESGMPTEEGGLVYLLYLYNAIDEDPMNATVPSGVYETGTEKTEWTLFFEHSAAFLKIDGQVLLSTVEGQVKVSRENGEYNIIVDADLPMLSSDETAHLVAQYKGDLNIIDITAQLMPEIEEDVELEFEAAYGRYYGNFYLPHADDINLTFTVGETKVSSNGVVELVDGYSLYLYSVYMPKLEDYNTDDVVIAEGTYSIDTDRRWLLYSESTLPYLIDKGIYEKNPFGEDYIQVGSYLQYIDKETGDKREALLESGTMDVVHSGSGYEIVFSFTAANGISVEGSFSGEFDGIGNYNDNDLQPIMAARPWTTLTGDHTLTFIDGTELIIYNAGNYLLPEYDQIIFTLTHPTQPCELIMAQVVVDRGAADAGLPTGTYTVSWDIEPYSILPGWYSMNTDPLYTWFGDSNPDPNDPQYSKHIVAIAAGSIEISKDASGNYTLDIAFEDQAGHKITGSWTGPLIIPSN